MKKKENIKKRSPHYIMGAAYLEEGEMEHLEDGIIVKFPEISR